MCFQYSEEREEKKQSVQPVQTTTELKPGDRVNVSYSSRWNGPATLTGIEKQYGFTFYIVKMDDGHTGGFYRENLTLISTPVKTGFKIGDRVRVKVSRRSIYSLIPATVVGESREVYGQTGHVIKIDNSGNVIYFFDKNLEYLPVRETVSAPVAAKTQTIGSAYIAGTNAAHRLAKQNGTVTADQVQAELAKIGYTSRDLGNAAGSIFRASKFRKVGEVNSTRPGNRGRKIAQWGLVSA